MTTEQHRPLREIARDIRADWGEKVYFGAVPYLEALARLDDINDTFGFDSARSIVLYFLANAQKWRGPVARRIKTELKELTK